MDSAPTELTDPESDRKLTRTPTLLCVHHALMMSLFPIAGRQAVLTRSSSTTISGSSSQKS